MGYLVLLRTTGHFTAAETALLASAAPLLAAALRDAVLSGCAASQEEQSAPAVLALDAHDRCVSLTEQARRYLSFPATITPSRLPEAIHLGAARARAQIAGRSTDAACSVVPAQAGTWLSCQGAALDDAGSVVIILHPMVLAAYGLTVCEREIATAVLRAEPTEAIARRLCLSPWTVQDHLKSVFGKTGVRSRTDLRLLLLPPPSAARAESGQRLPSAVGQVIAAAQPSTQLAPCGACTSRGRRPSPVRGREPGGARSPQRPARPGSAVPPRPAPASRPAVRPRPRPRARGCSHRVSMACRRVLRLAVTSKQNYCIDQ
jgi:DNA-binding CsgD family transcriptional regulator